MPPTNQSVLITGSSGLIGSESLAYLDRLGATVHGVDNNMRADFFGKAGDTSWNLARLKETCRNFTHHHLDIRDREAVDQLVAELQPHMIVHTAAQPSHDLVDA